MRRIHITVTGQTTLAGITNQLAEELCEELEERFATEDNALEADLTKVAVNDRGYEEFTIGLISHESFDTQALEEWIYRQDGGHTFEAGCGDEEEGHTAFDQ